MLCSPASRNHLACLLSELDKNQLEVFEAVIDKGDHTSCAADLINLAQNLDCYPKTKNVLAKTKKECLEKLQALKESCGGTASAKVRPEMPFGDWLNYWFEHHSKPKG